MKLFATIVLAALVLPTVIAGSNSQSGVQTGTGWSESTFIAVQGGTGFTLTSDTADFDVFFYNSNGGFVGASIACGNDAGIVPATATQGEITKWDNLGAAAGGALACTKPVLGLPGLPAQWTFTDGL